MKKRWNIWMKDILLIYCGVYTLATIVSSVSYLAQGIFEDPAGNWHEIDRAVIALIITLAYGLIRYLKISNFIVKAIIVYIPTMLLSFLYVFLRGLTATLASSAYRDIFVNFTVGFVMVAVIAFVVRKIVFRKKN